MSMVDLRRVYAKPHARVPLDEAGFLATDLIPFAEAGAFALASDLLDLPWFALVGEPGSGKTLELRSLAKLAGARMVDLGRHNRLVDVAAALIPPQPIELDVPIRLYLDGLDESLTHAGDVAREMVDWVTSLSEAERKRLRLGIACRTGAWPTWLGDALNALLRPKAEETAGSASVVFELLPMSRADAQLLISAARGASFDAAGFIDRHAARGLGPLLSRPKTLQALLTVDGDVDDRWQLYENTLRRACLESRERQTRPHPGAWTQGRRFALLERIAAGMLLTSRVYLRRSEQAAPEADELLVEDLAEEQGVPLDGAVVPPAAVRAALVSEPLPLQEGRTEDHLLFHHRTDAEFLAASFLSRLAAAREVLEGPDGHVHPQLAELAGWLAVRDADLREWLLSTDPDALLLGDTAAFTASERERLVDELLGACRDGRLADHVGGWENHLGRLGHERLPLQLATWLVPSGDFVARRVAIEIGRSVLAGARGPTTATAWAPFLDRLATLALDASEPLPLRIRAASALEQQADLEQIERLRPLVDWARGDADGELAGIALRGLWRTRLLTAAEVFRVLVPPHAGFSGAYSAFVRYALPSDLPSSALPLALGWVRENITGHEDDRGWFREHFGRRVLTDAWRIQQDPLIGAALLDTVATLLRRHLSAPLDVDIVRGDDAKRRAFIRALVTQTDVYVFQIGRVSGLLSPTDVYWLLDWHKEEADPAVRQRVRRLAGGCLDFTDAAIADRALIACAADAELEADWCLLRPVDLDDPNFEHQRAQARREATQREERIDGELWIERHLAAIPDAPHRFYNLMHALTVSPETGKAGDPFNTEPEAWPGWAAASTERTEQICKAAATFLSRVEPDPKEWGKGKGVQSFLLAGGWALVLVAERPDLEGTVSDERLAQWALAFLWHCARDRPEEGRVCALFARRIPNDFVQALARVVEACGESHEAERAVRRAAGAWCPAVETWMSAHLERGSLVAEVDAAALQALATARPERAEQLAWKRLERGDGDEQHVVHSAEFLFRTMQPEAFSRWWPLASSPTARLQAVVQSYAHRRYWDGRHDSGLARFAAEDLASLLRALIAAYPPEDDPDHRGRFHAVLPSDDAIRLRDAISGVLVERALPNDIRVLASLSAEFPDQFRWGLVRARQTARRRDWVPLTARALWRVLAGGSRRERRAVEVEAPVPPPHLDAARTRRTLRILHISDLHERTRYSELPAGRMPLVELDEQERGLVLGGRFDEALSSLVGPGIDLVCFTGDIADWGRPEELAAARTRVHRLLDLVRVPPERFFAVPGNHDVQRRVEIAAWRRLRTWQAQAENPSAVGRWFRGAGSAPLGLRQGDRERLLARTAAFWTWLREVRGDELRGASPRLGYRHSMPVGTFEHVPVPVHIVGLDSAWSCGGDDDAARILVTGEQVLDHLRIGPGGLDGFRLALVHHPLEHLADQHEVRRWLADDGVDLLLHGHQHEPMASIVSEPGTSLPVLAAGCLMEGERGRNWPNGFNLVEIDLPAGECRVRFRKWSRDGRFWAHGTDLYRTADGDGVVLRLRGPR